MPFKNEEQKRAAYAKLKARKEQMEDALEQVSQEGDINKAFHTAAEATSTTAVYTEPLTSEVLEKAIREFKQERFPNNLSELVDDIDLTQHHVLINLDLWIELAIRCPKLSEPPENFVIREEIPRHELKEDGTRGEECFWLLPRSQRLLWNKGPL